MASKYFKIETLTETKIESSNDVFNKIKSVVGKTEACKILMTVETQGTYTLTGSGEVVVIKKSLD